MAEREETEEEADEEAFDADETITSTEIAEHPAVHNITGVYRTVGMATVSVSTLKRVKANEYEITIKNSGALGLQLVRTNVSVVASVVCRHGALTRNCCCRNPLARRSRGQRG